MRKLSKSIEEYEKAGGWSSSLFHPHAVKLLKELKQRNVEIEVGRTVIYVDRELKVYVHNNGRSKEYATVTDMNGKELITRHISKVEELMTWIEDFVFAP